MVVKKTSLLERLTGGVSDEYEEFEDEHLSANEQDTASKNVQKGNEQWNDEEVGELAVDVYQTPTHVVVKALVAGVTPNNIDISVTREMLTIRGAREDECEVEGDGYFQKELYWGSFSRTILLPEEVDVDQAEAHEKHGILVIRLPKVNKSKQNKIKVRSR
jgi:HSP20 family protein